MDIAENLKYRFGAAEDVADLNSAIFDSMVGRASCRSFSSRDVAPALLRSLCAVALSAPSKSDLQQRDIIVLESPEQRARITGLFPEGDWTREAPRFLVFCGNNRRQRQLHQWHNIEFANDHLDAFFNAAVDAAIALATFVTAAEAAGLGCCPVSAIRNHCRQVSNILELPDHVFPVAGLGLGWPNAPGPVAPRLPLDLTVHSDRFSEDNIRTGIADYDRYRQRHQPYARQLHETTFGHAEDYGWSQEKARQYSVTQRQDFGRFIRDKGFELD